MPGSTTKPELTPHDQERLIRSLDRQAAIGLELRSLSQRQRELLSERRSDAVLEVVTDRQALVDELTDLDSQCRPFFENWSNTLEMLNPQDRNRAVELRKSLSSSIEQVLETDEVDRASLEAQRQGIDSQLRMLARGRTTNRAYVDSHAQSSANPENRYTDRQG